jgi:hypothetical protein
VIFYSITACYSPTSFYAFSPYSINNYYNHRLPFVNYPLHRREKKEIGTYRMDGDWGKEKEEDGLV